MKIKKINLRNYGVIIGFLVLCAIISFATPAFLTTRNILNLLRQSAVVGVLSAGMTLIIISGNFDISVGYICGCAGAIAAVLLNKGFSFVTMFVVVILFGALVGTVSGFAVAKLAIPSMIATLGMGQVINGALLLITGGYPISIQNDAMTYIGKESFLGIPVPIYLFVIAIILVNIVLRRTVLGRHIYSVGGNDETSRLSGIRVDFVKIITYFPLHF